MAQLIIGTGTTSNDGNGDTLRAAFVKVNTNFTDLYDTVIPTAISSAVNTVVGSPPSSLDTIEKLAAAINDDASFYTTVSSDISAAVSGVIDGAPAALNTLDKLAAAINDDSTYFQTVNSQIDAVVGTAPNDLDTLDKLAAAINDDALFYQSINTLLGDKADVTSLAAVATTGSYTDLINIPDETDPVFTAHVTFGIASGDIDNWNDAYNFSTTGAAATYLTITDAGTTYQPLDGDLTAIAGLVGTEGFLQKTAADTWTLNTSINDTKIGEWDTAYNWGDHSTVGYLDATSNPDLVNIEAIVGPEGTLRKNYGSPNSTWQVDTSVPHNGLGDGNITIFNSSDVEVTGGSITNKYSRQYTKIHFIVPSSGFRFIEIDPLDFAYDGLTLLDPLFAKIDSIAVYKTFEGDNTSRGTTITAEMGNAFAKFGDRTDSGNGYQIKVDTVNLGTAVIEPTFNAYVDVSYSAVVTAIGTPTGNDVHIVYGYNSGTSKYFIGFVNISGSDQYDVYMDMSILFEAVV